ncbi:Clavaminate synthase-like protein [Stereum hirsutum FP-91666 SS1]|uniref:Clavaminate synthase-like protein n=1 Tax=Stereum hirsutum (strain FP-91666) TaxID=721885 RepID=UPI000440D28C|nr:Clavaminate synthase-like protein [Stereum hirsutum FP-91666 SS1]EIM91330.1 Clavaminate synthase-like protein [Stereum hirsutum FP-91666 SS1]
MTITFDIPPYSRPPPTKEELDYAPLSVVDLSKWDRPNGKEELVNDLRVAIEDVGFLFVVGHGIEDEEVLRQLSIGDAFFNLPLEVKRQHPCDFSVGNYFGYREPYQILGDSGVKSNIEMLNLPKDTPSLAHERLRYDFLEELRSETKAFQVKLHQRILEPLLKLFALLLELPEDYFSAAHAFDKPAEDHLRYMRYTPNEREVDAKIDNQYTKAHTDFGLLTILFPQIVNGLQVRTTSGEYKYVQYIPGHVVVNTAEVLTFLSGGYIKSTVHRVVRPPEDQAYVKRLGLLYFSRLANEFDVKVAPSPLLQRLGLYDPAKEDSNPPKGLEWGRARVKHTHNKVVFEHVDHPVAPFKYKNHEINLEYKAPPVLGASPARTPISV